MFFALLAIGWLLFPAIVFVYFASSGAYLPGSIICPLWYEKCFRSPFHLAVTMPVAMLATAYYYEKQLRMEQELKFVKLVAGEE